MKKQLVLLYGLERTLGLNPEKSRCTDCIYVEYIYFTGIVCHYALPKVTDDGLCNNFKKYK